MKFSLLNVLLLLSCLCSAQEDTLIATTYDFLPKQNIIDRVMSHFEYNHGRTSVKYYPSVGIDPASGIALGALSLISIVPKENDRKLIRFYRPTSISNMISYSTKKWINLKSDMVIYANHGIVVNTLIQYQVSPDKFYGIGNDTLNPNPVKFDMNDLRINGNVSKELSPTCFLGFNFDVSYRDCSELDNDIEDISLPKLKNKWLFGLGPHFTFDRRDNINYPTHGEYATLAFKYFVPQKQDSYTFYCIELDLRKYITIYKDLILGAQLFCGMSDGDMPFYSLYQLGGQTRLRGLSNKYMYIDKNAFFAQCELRKHIWNRFSLVAFGGAGNTSGKMSELNISKIKYVYGAGIRFQSDTKNEINLRLDYGRGSFGDSGVYMTMREAF